MTDTATNAPICKTQICKRPLTYLEGPKCWRCLVCNPIPKDKPKEQPVKPAFLDNKVTEERVREIVKDELENWHIPKPPVTKEEVKEIVKPETYLQKAKRLGIPTHYEANGAMAGGVRKKADVLKDIEAKERQGTDEEL